MQQMRPEALALSAQANKLYSVTREVLIRVPLADRMTREVCRVLNETSVNALKEITIQIPRIERAPGAWEDKWSIFSHSLALGVTHCANISYLVYGGIILGGANELLSQEFIDSLDKYRNYCLVIGNETLAAHPAALDRRLP